MAWGWKWGSSCPAVRSAKQALTQQAVKSYGSQSLLLASVFPTL